jgi:hypothetical protein
MQYFHRQPGPDQHSPLDRPIPTQGKKRNRVISNKNNKDKQQRGWGTLSTKAGEGNPSQNCNINKPGLAGEKRVEAQQPGAGKLVRVVEGGKLHRRGEKTHFPCEL